MRNSLFALDLPAIDEVMPSVRPATIQDTVSGYHRSVPKVQEPHQFAEVHLTVVPFVGDTPLLLEWQVPFNHIPGTFLLQILKGIQQAAHQGYAEYGPMLHLKVTITHGRYQMLDTGPHVLQHVAAQAFQNAMREANLVPLDPISLPYVPRPTPVTRLLEFSDHSGLPFAYIPPGTYPVGAPHDLQQSVLNRTYSNPKVFWMPPGHVELPGFFIATQLLRQHHLAALRHTQWGMALNIGKYTSTVMGQRARKRSANADDILSVRFREGLYIAQALGMTLPTWDQWEVATRGPQGYLYPWGNVFGAHSGNDISILAHDASYWWEDPVSDMGSRDREYIVKIYTYFESFGTYTHATSPFGLIDLARQGHEWNTSGEPSEHGEYPVSSRLLRSLCNLEVSPYGCVGTNLAMMLPSGMGDDEAAIRLVYQEHAGTSPDVAA